jgi:lysophospholipase L1-like esterase
LEEIPANVTTDVVLEETPDAGKEYIDKIYFVGESTTAHFFKGGIDRSHILVPSSATLTLGSDIIKILVGKNNLTIPEAVKKEKAEILIITIGVNNATNFSKRQYKAFYSKLIEAILNASPSTKIILQSSFPVTKEFSSKSNAISNEAIDINNLWTKELAKEYSLKYLDTQSILKNDSGALIEEYSNGDGIHLNEKGYGAIVQYIRTHAIE